jgi:hypothetical protein
MVQSSGLKDIAIAGPRYLFETIGIWEPTAMPQVRVSTQNGCFRAGNASRNAEGDIIRSWLA